MSDTSSHVSEDLYRDLFDNAPVGYHEVNLQGQIVRVNRTEALMLGYEPEEMIGHYAWEFVAERISQDAVRAKLAGTHPLVAYERTFIRKDRGTLPVMIEERLLRDGAGTACGIRTSVFDITRRKQAELAMAESEARYRKLVEHSPDAIIVQIDGAIAFTNDAAVKLLGGSHATSLLGLRLLDFMDESCREIGTEYLELASQPGGRSATSELRIRSQVGVTVDVEIIAMQALFENRPAIQMVLRDITVRKMQDEEIRKLAYHDALTHLPNRILFRDRLQMAMAHALRDNQKLAVLFVDLDRFKEINDSLGHAVGDLVLRAVATRLTSSVRDGDTVARLGGDEFVLMLVGLKTPMDAAAAAKNILLALQAPISVLDKQLYVTASIGASILPDDTQDLDGLLRLADAAMYRAKQKGRNDYQLFSAEMQVRASERYSIESYLPRALSEHQFRVHYQPVVSLRSGAVVGFEALARWEHAQQGLLVARQFMPIAERCGQVVELGDWVLEEACRMLVTWRTAHGPNLYGSINLSARQLHHRQFLETTLAILEASNVPPSALQFELSPLSVEAYDDTIGRAVETLASLGARIVVDNFGDCNCSLGYLSRPVIGGMKLDGRIVDAADSPEGRAGVAEAVVAACDRLALTTTATHVERATQFDRLQRLGFHAAQGNWIAPPMDAEGFEEFLVSSKVSSGSRS